MNLTRSQILKHWRDWNAVVAANSWQMSLGRLSPDARRRAGDSIWHRLVWRTADQMAQRESRGTTAADLRHATYIVATTNVPGWPRSARPVASLHDLRNREFSRVLTLWALLINPDDITASIEWDHPEQGQRTTLIEGLRKRAPEATLRAIAGNAFETRDWDQLTIPQLRWLTQAIVKQQRRYQAPVAAIGCDAEAQPF